MKPEIFVADQWEDYELIDTGDGKRLERWGDIILVRPDPQVLWPAGDDKRWRKPDAIYRRSSSGGGKWDYLNILPEEWNISYESLVFKVKPTNFKHTGLFPEQAYNWSRIMSTLTGGENVLNLFGYTGAATIAAAKAGAKVVHVDASKGMLTWCKENAQLSKLSDTCIRVILDDCLKFVERENRRGNKYDGIIMDPPSFGRGAKGEVWKLENSLWELLSATSTLFSDNAKFLLINSYTAGMSSIVVYNMVKSLNLPFKKLTFGELVIPFRKNTMYLPCGMVLWAE